MDHYEELWESLKIKLEEKLSSTDYNDLVKTLKYSRANSNNIYLIAPDALTTYRIKKFILNKMNDIFKTISNEGLRIDILNQEVVEKEVKPDILKPDSIESYTVRTIRPENTFDTFVIGENNRFAFLTAMKAAESPYEVANPLYIFGDVGLGKTHLMMAIGNYVLDKNSRSNIVYAPAQQFAEDYYAATHKVSGKNIESFYDYYKSADVLLVDDIQFLSGKNATQEEFFKIFEYLNENNKQIIITSDKPANELENIMARLKSRFSWGIMVDIKRPDYEHRKLIVKKKLSFLISNPDDVPEEVIDYIALNFDENVRELEGAVRRLVSYTAMLSEKISLESAKKALEGIIRTNVKKIEVSTSSKAEKIKVVVANYYQIDVKELEGQSKKKEIVWPRQVAMYLLRTQLSLPLVTVGEFFGGRDHTTVVHAEEKIRKAIQDNDWTVQNQIDNLCKKLEEK